MSRVLYDRKLSARDKGKRYKSVVRSDMLCEMEAAAVTERQVGKMEVAELKMVRRALGVTKKDKIRNENLRGTAKIAKLGDKQAMLIWTREKERGRLRGKKDNGDGGARQKEKRKTKEKVDGFGERRHGKGWS